MAKPRPSVIRPHSWAVQATTGNPPRTAPSLQVQGPTTRARPAYITVAVGDSSRLPGESKVKGGSPVQTPGLASPQNWPPGLKAYVERAFKVASLSNRSKLQEILRVIIGDAQKKGDWAD
jgi:hypothetical protein